MTTQERIEARLRQALGAEEVRIEDLSQLHRGHPGATGEGGHYRIRVVAARFEGRSLLERHRMVHAALPGMIGGEIHALSLETVAPGEA